MAFEMEKIYNPQSCEDRIYKNWEDKGYFHAEVDESKEPFCVVMPPPNITGKLHAGHALDCTLQDTIIRFKRMKGFSTLWLPGTDHASIATEVRIIEQMAKEGKTKAELGRDGFLERAWAWREEYGRTIVEQLKRMGSSCDWERERFTMDEGCNKAVREVFVNLYNKGLIYRGNRIINWCPECKTALSDAEVEYEEKDSHLWHLKYPLTDGSGYLVVATTRPETMMGDTAVAVNPEDDRYKDMIGKTIMLPLMNREIPIIADSYVDLEFGTGAVKITPAHDPNDYEMGKRHDIETINIMHEDGTLNENAGAYNGMGAMEARKKVVEDLEKLGLLIKIEDHAHNVGQCYRCDTVVEPLISKQWFVNMQPLADPAIDAVNNDDVQFIPERFSKIYFNWMNNIRDWCISRQLWWGHRIPAWYCEDCGEMMVSKEDPTKCSKCGSTNLKQDEDVLDTWFSSALWPFSTLGWPEKTEELDYFYPTDVLITGYDIIFFWVARMIFSGLEHVGEKPFKHVLIHGLVRDAQGRKMSKSLGNGVDPLEVIAKYGADALRYSLLIGNAPGNDMRYIESKVEASRNFANKIWNASRFVLMNMDGKKPMDYTEVKLDITDKWILTELNRLNAYVSEKLNDYELGLALQKVYDFFWSEFCDWYIELCKSRLYDGTEAEKQAALAVLYKVLGDALKMLHPFMPFVTEEIYAHLPGTKGSIMVKSWPTYEKEYTFDEDCHDMETVMEIIRAIRNIRAEMKVPVGKKTRILLKSAEGKQAMLQGCATYITKLAFGQEVAFLSDSDDVENMVSAVCEAATIYLPLNELVDIEKELTRINKEIENTKGEIKRSEGKLNNPGFVNKAPEAVVNKERENLEKKRAKLSQLEGRLAQLGG